MLFKGRSIHNKAILFICLSLLFIFTTNCQKSQKAKTIKWDKIPGNLTITYPQTGTLFPPDIIAPTLTWKDGNPQIKNWFIQIHDENKTVLTSAFISSQSWKIAADSWNKIKTHYIEKDIQINILGIDGTKIITGDSTIIRISKDSVNAPIFYRAVPLPFSFALKNLEMIRWHLGDISSEQPAPALLSNIPLCGNCHSFSADGKILAMDVDYANDKGSYVVSEIAKETILTEDEIFSWSNYHREDGEDTFGLLSQISHDGRYVASTVKDRSIFVAKDDLHYSQLFFPIKGIIVIYDRQSKKFWSLPGANDPKYVQSNPNWSPDGQYIYFTKAPVYNMPELSSSKQVVIPTSYASDFIEGRKNFKYDIYRIPFNNGKGGKAVPVTGASKNGLSNYFPRISPDGKWLVFAQANNFMLLQPDSKLFILPVNGGTPRKMNCNTSNMNSWHSWSPNGKWLVFASKLRGAYTDLLLTHIDENGNDSPPVILENFSFENRANNIPEFVNINPIEWQKIVDDFSNQSHYYLTQGTNKLGEKKYQQAIELFNKVIALEPQNTDAYIYKGHSEFELELYEQAIETYDKAIALKSDNIDVYINKGTAKYKLGKYQDAIKCYDKALFVNDKHAYAYFARGLNKAKIKLYKEAIDDFTKSIQLDNNSDKTYYERGLCFALLNQFDKSASDFKEAIRLNPKNFLAFKYLGNSYYSTKKFKQAILAYNSAIEITPEDKELYSFRGVCKISIRDYNGALADYNSALKLSPNSGVDYCQRGVIKIKLGLKQEGCDDLERALQLGFMQATKEIKRYCSR